MDDNVANTELHDLWVLLAHTYRLMARLRDRELTRYEFTREQALILSIIHHLGDEATPSRITRYQVQAHNTVSEILDRMRKSGLIEKIPEASGRNRIKIRLTRKGELAYQQSLKRDYLLRIIGALSPEQRQQLFSCLEILRDKSLEEIGEIESWPEIRVQPSRWASLKRQSADNK